MIEVAEVVYHWQKGQSKTQIAKSLGISRPTVRKYLKIAEEAGLTREADATATAKREHEGVRSPPMTAKENG